MALYLFNYISIKTMKSSAKGLKLKASGSKDVKVVTKNGPKLSKVNNMLFFRKIVLFKSIRNSKRRKKGNFMSKSN